MEEISDLDILDLLKTWTTSTTGGRRIKEGGVMWCYSPLIIIVCLLWQQPIVRAAAGYSCQLATASH